MAAVTQLKPGDFFMISKLSRFALLAGIVFAAGCAGQIDSVRQTAEQALSAANAAQTAADNAQRTANEARQMASGAQSSANQALSAANAAQSCCDATNQRLDRMFQQSQAK
jgi:murein lipoprotein